MNTLLEQALITVEEMLDDRNYIPLSNTFPELDIFKRMNNRKYLTPKGLYALVSVVESTSQIKNLSNYIDDSEFETILFVYTNNVTVAHQSIEKNLCYKIEIWSVYNLLINISKNMLQPKIEKVEKLNFKGKLPKICFYDPIARYYRFQPRDILKITNKEGFVNYRIVV